MSQHPALLGVLPSHTRIGQLLLSLRKLIEPEFGVQTLWTRLKSLPFRGLHNFKLFAQLHSLSNSSMISISALLAGCAVVTIGNLLFLSGS